jgi:hypothetical protein
MNLFALMPAGAASRFAPDPVYTGSIRCGWPFSHASCYSGAKDRGVQHGDRADTGDNEARPSGEAGPEGSGVEGGFAGGATGRPTGDASALGGSVRAPKGGRGATEEGGTSMRDQEGPVD